jgi:hypothetical protein
VSRRFRLALWLYVPLFLLVFWGVRAAWLAYLATLNESELHRLVHSHSTAGPLILWGACFALTLILALGFAHVVDRLLAGRG